VSSELLGTILPLLIVTGGIFTTLFFVERARTDWKFSGVIVLLMYLLILVPMSVLGAGLVGPIGIAEIAPALGMYGLVFLVCFLLWCAVMALRNKNHG
jgi:hypothetical protein